MKPATCICAIVALAIPLLPLGHAQGQTASQNITINSIGEDNSTSFQSGIANDSQVVGITIINNEIWIDGEKVPRGATKFTGRSGKNYRIERVGGAIQVRDE